MKKLYTAKLKYYLTNLINTGLGRLIKPYQLEHILKNAELRSDYDTLLKRRDYYCKLGSSFSTSDGNISPRQLNHRARQSSLSSTKETISSAYYFDFKAF